MKTKYLIRTTIVMLLAAWMISPMGPAACKDYAPPAGDPAFEVEGKPTGIKVSAEGVDHKYTVRANRPWKVVAQSEQGWARPFPAEGLDDGIFTMMVAKNDTVTARAADFAFVVDGKEEPVLFRVEQEAAVPSLAVTPAPLVAVLSKGGVTDITVLATMRWNYTLGTADWLQEITRTKTGIRFTALPNETGLSRETTLSIAPIDALYANLDTVITIRQTSERIDDGQPAGYVYFEDKFDWVTPFGGPDDMKTVNDWISSNYPAGGYPASGYPSVTGTFNMYSKAPEGGAAGDLAAAFVAQGYTDINLDAGTVYFAAHYLKFGRTDVQSGIQRTIPGTMQEKMANIRLTFDAAPCITGGGNYDPVYMVVELSGPGSVGVDDGTTKRGADISIMQENRTFPWAYTTCDVILYGVTSDTKVIIKTNKSGTDSDVFRYYFDNLKFVKHSAVTP